MRKAVQNIFESSKQFTLSKNYFEFRICGLLQIIKEGFERNATFQQNISQKNKNGFKLFT